MVCGRKSMAFIFLVHSRFASLWAPYWLRGSTFPLQSATSTSMPLLRHLRPPREPHTVSYLLRQVYILSYSSSFYKSVTTRYTTTKILHQPSNKRPLDPLTISSTYPFPKPPPYQGTFVPPPNPNQQCLNLIPTQNAQAYPWSQFDLHCKNPTPPSSRSTPQATKSDTNSKLKVLHKNKAQ